MSRRRAVVLFFAVVAIVAYIRVSHRPTRLELPSASASSAARPPVVSRQELVAPRVAATRFVLPPAHHSHGPSTISGIVHHTDGTPAFASITIITLPPPSTRRDIGTDVTPHATESNRDGTFSAEVGPGDYAIYASDDSRASQLLTPVSVSPGEGVDGLELTLSGPTAATGTVVTDAGHEVRALVSVRIPSLHVVLVESSTLRAGRFHFPSLPDAPVTLVATSGDLEGELVLPRPTENAVVRIHEPRVSLVCEVVDAAGNAFDGASVQVTYEGGMTFTSSDESGRAIIRGARGHTQVFASSDGLSSAEATLELDDTEQHVRLVLLPAAKVTGRVLTHNHQPASGHVTIALGGDDVADAALDDDGAYSLLAIPSGHFTLVYVQHAGDDPAASLPFVSSATDVELPDLVLPASHTVHGRVLDADGEPVSEADVDVVSVDETSFDGAHVETGEDGTFELETIGALRIRATSGSATSIPMLVHGDDEVTLRLATSGSLDGIVRGVSDKAEVRCAGGLWHPVDASGQYHLPCNVGAALEVRDGKETRSFGVEVDPDETSYAEVRWSPP